MSAPPSHSHRPTQKQTNKSFKSKHASKGSLKDAAKGRTHRPALKPSSKSTNATVSAAHKKQNRRNQAKQLQEKKQAALEEVGKIFARKGADRVSRVVALVPLTADVDPAELAEQLMRGVGLQCVGAGAVRTAE